MTSSPARLSLSEARCDLQAPASACRARLSLAKLTGSPHSALKDESSHSVMPAAARLQLRDTDNAEELHTNHLDVKTPNTSILNNTQCLEG
jgi:hypothetical protein